MSIARTEAEALATFIQRVRPDWDRPGILAAIHKAQTVTGSPAAIGAALCRLAENHELRTPALLTEPGPHWGQITAAARKPPTRCPDHPTERLWDCAPCRDAATPGPTEDYQAQVRTLLAERKRYR